MKRIIAIADQSTLPMLKFLAAINILFLLSLAAILGMAVGQARAGEMAAAVMTSWWRYGTPMPI